MATWAEEMDTVDLHVGGRFVLQTAGLAIRSWPVLHHDAHRAAVVRCKEHATTSREIARVLLADQSDGGRVDQRRNLLDLGNQHAVKQSLVAVMEPLEHEILLERVIKLPKAIEEILSLLLQCFYH